MCSSAEKYFRCCRHLSLTEWLVHSLARSLTFWYLVTLPWCLARAESLASSLSTVAANWQQNLAGAQVKG